MTRYLASLVLAVVLPTHGVTAQTVQDSVVASVREALRAMGARDVEASRAVLLGEGRAGIDFSIREGAEGLTIRRTTHEEYLASLRGNPDSWVERIWAPTVLVHGPLAMVWTPYDFHVDGAFSHCGTDIATSIRTDEGWQNATWTWSVEHEGCSPGPLGPLTAGSTTYPAPLPIPQVWDTAWVVLLEANPGYSAPDSVAAAVMQGHFQYQLRLIAEGRTIRGGPLIPEAGRPLVGVTLLRAGSRAEAEALAGADPAVAAGRFRAQIRGWMTPQASPAPAATDERSAVVATVQEFFRAMTAKDLDASRRVLLEGGVNYATRQDPDSLYLARFTHEEYLERLKTRESTVVERMWTPTVLVQGRVALLWTSYDIHLDGEFLHCGVDAFALVRPDDGWKISSIAFTMEPSGCAPSPLGPLR